jgi:hypothetical protein
MTKRNDEFEQLARGFLRLRKRWLHNIPLFFRHAFMLDKDEELTWQQELVLREFSRANGHVSIASGHGTGKSSVLAIIIIWAMCVFDEVKVGVTGPTAPQLSDVLLSEVRKWTGKLHPWLREQVVVQMDAVTVRSYQTSDAPPHWATFRTTKIGSPDALQGLHADNMIFVVDEAFGVADPVYEVIEGALTTEGARAILAGNPTSTAGYAFETFHRNRDTWTRIRLNGEDSPLVSKEAIAKYQERYGVDNDVYRIRVKGLFARSAVGQLITREAVDAALKKQHMPEIYRSSPSILGVDCSGYGGDKSVIVHRKGVFSEVLFSTRFILDTNFAGMIFDHYNRLNAATVFVDVGYGQGVIAMLKELGVNVQGVNFGASGYRPHECRDRKTECWVDMQKWIEKEDGMLPPKPIELHEDLVGPRLQFTSKGVKFIEAKKDMKKRGLSSPDYADALALTFAAPVANHLLMGFGGFDLGRGTVPRGRLAIGYDPISEFDI